jgi:DNA-binding SARP family transcriptional activator
LTKEIQEGIKAAKMTPVMTRETLTTLELRLIGVPQVFWEGQTLDLPPPKSFALLAYLAMKAAPLQRHDLSELLWGTTKSSSLRVALSELRTLPGADDWLIADDQLLSVRVATDVAAFEEACRAGAFLEALESW